MTFDQIRYFIAVVEQDTYFDAAEELNISQSTLSKQIIKLEQELHVSLIDRSRRKASLTPAGETFYQEALLLIRQYERMSGHMKKFQNADKNELHIGTLPILTQYELTSKFQNFSHKYPNIHLIIDEVEESDLKKGLLSGSYDLIICREQILPELASADTYIDSVPIAEDELVAVLPFDHPLLFKNTDLRQLTDCPDGISLSDLSAEQFLLMNRYTSVYQICQHLFENAGVHPQILRTARVESIISAVAIGEGISLLPYSNFKLFHHEYVQTMPLVPPVKLPVIIAGDHDRMHSPVCQQFIHIMTEST